MSDCEIVMVHGVEDANGYPCGGSRSLSVATAEPNSATCILSSATIATKRIAACVTSFTWISPTPSRTKL
jgi:hypothetical protein